MLITFINPSKFHNQALAARLRKTRKISKIVLAIFCQRAGTYYYLLLSTLASLLVRECVALQQPSVDFSERREAVHLPAARPVAPKTAETKPTQHVLLRTRSTWSTSLSGSPQHLSSTCHQHQAERTSATDTTSDNKCKTTKEAAVFLGGAPQPTRTYTKRRFLLRILEVIL